ncbi:MAG TPA: OmpA family protein [Puia sp.]|jgi:outer membrane protein OmpA-like peptidoglycan-associated protein|nr:OmpA family protein [Puia sp.]
MALNFLDSLKDIFTPDRIKTAAASLGEGETNISKAISGIAPAIIGGIISKTDSGIDGASSILNMAKGAAGTGILPNLTNRFGDLKNGDFVTNGLDTARRLLGDKLDTITSTISRFAGIRESSVSSLLAVAAPAALGILGKHATDTNLTPASLSSMLSGQKTAVAASLPVGLASFAGWITGPATPARNPIPVSPEGVRHTVAPVSTPETRPAPPPRRNWFWPILIGIVLLLLLIYLVRGCGKTGTAGNALNDTVSAGNQTSGTPESIKVKLPDGTVLDAFKGGIEDKLIAYLNSTFPEDSVSNDRWFDFDDLNFKTGSAEITNESMRQVRNIDAILKAYPKVSLKIGGYTDKTGNEDQNLKLSQDRAEAVLNALKQGGVADGQLVGAEGYGSKFARAPADAPDEQRRADRRISVSVRSK